MYLNYKYIKLEFVLSPLEIDYCESNPCQHGARCTSQFDIEDYVCDCPKCYKGKDCNQGKNSNNMTNS